MSSSGRRAEDCSRSRWLRRTCVFPGGSRSWWRHERGEPRQELDRRHHAERAAAAGVPDAVRHAPVSKHGEPLEREAGPRAVARKPLAALAVVRLGAHGGVHVEPVELSLTGAVRPVRGLAGLRPYRGRGRRGSAHRRGGARGLMRGGERRLLSYRGMTESEALLEAIPDLIERMYSRYLRTVWVMSFLADGKWPSRPPGTLGALVKQVGQRVQTYAGLVDADAGHLRNAVAHRHAEYLPSKRSIAFRDPPAGWQKTLTPAALEAQLMAMCRVTMMLTNELRSVDFLTQYLRCGLFPLLPLLRDALRGDAVAAKALADRNLEATLTAQFLRRKPPPGTELWFLSPT